MEAKANAKDILEKDGLIAKSLKNYEERPEQIEMAKAVAEAILFSKHLIVEAGTGIGKSIAYLVPFIYWATKEKKRVVISTYTKTLQQQLVEKDLPFLKKALDVDLQFSLCLGGENYLCLRRVRTAQSYDLFASKEAEEELTNLHKWQKKTETGLKQDLPFEPSHELWASVCRMRDLCLGNDCLYKDDCYYNYARKAQYRSHLLVCNHHLYFANLSSGNKSLPSFDAVVFDEAHSIEDVATNYLGKEVSNFRIKTLCDSLINPKTQKGILTAVKAKRIETAEDILARVRASSTEFFSNLVAIFGKETITRRIKKPDFIYNSLTEPLSALSWYLIDSLDCLSENERIEVSAFAARIEELKDDLSAIIKQTLKDYVYWIEIVNRPNFTKYALCAAPINIADEFKKQVLDKISPIVFTSATLSTNGSFDYIKGRLKLNDCQDLLLSSPFNYKEQALLYLASDLPDPSTELAAYESGLLKRIEELLSISKVGTFILFTSFKLLNRAYDALKDAFPERHLLKQGQLSQYKLLEEFKEGGTSVLFGTSTFWQGIDVPGKGLESVIITKLPFAVPDDPIEEARKETLLSENIDPFYSYQVPQAIIMLKQGFGRLIRTKNDVGLIAILDPRIKTKSYGKRFLNSLPLCKEAKTLKEIEDFFLQIENKKEKKGLDDGVIRNDNFDVVIRDIFSKEKPRRKKAILQLMRFKQERVLDALKCKTLNDAQKTRVVWCLGEMKNKDGVDFLISCLDEKNANIRRLSCSALGKIKAYKATAALSRVLTDFHPQVRQYAIKALGKLNDPKVIPALFKIAEDPLEKDYNRSCAETAIKRIKDGTED